MRGLRDFGLAGALLGCATGALTLFAAPAAAQGSYSPYNETPAAALARYVRALADNPKDFDSLIGAGRAALALGDTQAAAGFFARADDVQPRSPQPQEGMGAVQAAKGDPRAAMPYFARAQQLGATQTMLGCDRGLAYDLLGDQAKAQADYRAALSGADGDEARRRLALSLAVGGDRANALAMLAPLAAKGDSTTTRLRAFILALTGDPNAAMTAVDSAMPGSWARVAPFLQRLATLPAGEKAAAVNLGIFPDSNQPAYAYATPTSSTPPALTVTGSVSTDRLTGIDALLRDPTPAQAQPQPTQPVWQPPAAKSVQVAYVSPPRPASVQRTADAAATKIWLQLASGENADALENQFDSMKAHNPDLFKGIGGYVAKSSDRARLLIGPFRGKSDAEILADDLHIVGIDAFRWTNSQSDPVVPLASE
jgi:Flp pilus assembly protein TadD